jgi:hypothetical protein
MPVVLRPLLRRGTGNHYGSTTRRNIKRPPRFPSFPWFLPV